MVRGLASAEFRGHEISWRADSQKDVAGTSRRARGNVSGNYDGEGWAEDEPFIELRSRPNFFMRLRRVFGCRSRILAAPWAPSITHLVWVRTSRMCCFSTCSRECDSPFAGWQDV